MIAERILASALISGTLVVAGLAGMLVTMAPKLISLLVEPLSLLLTPGLIFAIASAGPHDFHPPTVVMVSLIFYFAAAFLGLSLHARTVRLRNDAGRSVLRGSDRRASDPLKRNG